MRERIGELVARLRDASVPVSVAETLDAHAAAIVAGFEREPFKEALAATLVKNHAHRAAFEAAFAATFPAPREKGRAQEPRGGEELAKGRPQPAEDQEGQRLAGTRRPAAAGRGDLRKQVTKTSESRLARRERLATTSFRELQDADGSEIRELAEELSRRLHRTWSRRIRRARRGRVDLRRTARRAAARGGIALEILKRRARPGRPELVALVDLSWSTRLASEMLLSLLAPCERFFSRVELLGYVDSPVAISLEKGHVVPHEPMDFGAPSDLGRVLAKLVGDPPRIGRSTMLLVLGDGRNNRRPPRVGDLATLHDRCGMLAWIVPEGRELWGRGDSVIPLYARHVDLLLPAPSARGLVQALARLPPRLQRRKRLVRAAGEVGALA